MDNYDISFKIIEEELLTFWPEWHVVERIGRGTFGDVFRIKRDNYGTAEESALKIIRIRGDMELSDYYGSNQEKVPGESEKDIGEPAVPEALSNEIKIMRALRGAPNIVVIEDFYFKRIGTSSTLFVRMELLTSFQEALQKSRDDWTAFSVDEVYKIGSDICTALMYCEKKGIIHRDIKPANLFMDGFGNYKIGDFGASSRIDTVYAAHTMTAIGTISYMAPEVFKGQSYNNTVDIYALGLILYQILNKGRIAFLSASGPYGARDIDNANFRRLSGEPLPALAEIYSGDEKRTVDASLDAIIRKACAPNAEDRFQTAEEFRDALREWKNAPNGSTRNIFNGQQGKEWNTEEKNSQKQVISNEQDNNRNLYSGNGRAGKQKPSSRIKVLLSAVILVLSVMIVFLGAFILNRDRNSKADRIDHSDGEELNESVSSTSGISDPAEIEHAESNTGMTEAVLSASYDEEDKNDIRGTITDSWEGIMAAEKDGTYLDKYHVGDTKELDLGEEGMILMELVAVEECDWNGNPVSTTWVAKDPLKSRHRMNSNPSSEGGWQESEMRTWLRENILPLFPTELQVNILDVERYSEYHYTSPAGEKNGVALSYDKIWIPSYQEIFHSDENDLFSPDFSSCFSDEESCIRISRDEGKPLWWWLRSSRDDSAFDRIGIDGKSEQGDADSEGGVIIGFSL